MAENTVLQDLNAILPVWIYKFPTPKTAKFSYEATFSKVEPETSEALKKITGAREEIKAMTDVEAFGKGPETVEKYLPSLLGLLKASESLPPEFSKEIKIRWTTPIGYKYAKETFMNPSLRWDLLMCLLAEGIMYNNYAQEVLLSTPKDLFDSKSKEIAGYLCKAAGIFEYIGGVELPIWTDKPDISSVPEFWTDTYMAMSELLIAEAHVLTMKKGCMSGLSCGALSKVAAEIFKRFEKAATLLDLVKVSSSELIPSLSKYFSLNGLMWRAISLRLVAEDARAKGSYGEAVATMKKAVSILVDQKKDPFLANLLNNYANVKKYITDVYSRFNEENDTIYMEGVPSELGIVFPDGKPLMKPTAYALPTAADVPVKYKQGGDCVLQ